MSFVSKDRASIEEVKAAREVVSAMLAEGLSVCAVAAHFGVSETTLRRVTGKRVDAPGAHTATRARVDRPMRYDVSSRTARRCRGCGGLVYGKCRLCEVRSTKGID